MSISSFTRSSVITDLDLSTTLQGSVGLDTLFRWGGERFHDFTANSFGNYTFINWQCFAIQPPSPSLTDSATCAYHVCYLHCQIPWLANSTLVTVTAKFHYLQIPHSARNYTLPSNSDSSCKFQDNWFTAKFHYLQIHTTHSGTLMCHSQSINQSINQWLV